MEHHTTPEWIFSCEHAANKIPDEYLSLFEGFNETLQSHRGWDPGAYQLAKQLSKKSEHQLFSYPYSRLLVEPNRSMGHPKLFSEFTKQLPTSKKKEIIQQYYLPYRNKLADLIQNNSSKGITSIHVGVHTFTPVLNKKLRNFEIGFLYDPSRVREKTTCKKWKSDIIKNLPNINVRMNQPYKGVSDGLITCFRKEFDLKFYLGIELEVNQKLVQDRGQWSEFCITMGECFTSIRDQITTGNIVDLIKPSKF